MQDGANLDIICSYAFPVAVGLAGKKVLALRDYNTQLKKNFETD